MHQNHKIKILLKSMFLLVVVTLSVNALAVWAPPTLPPTDPGNTPSPVNVGSALQFKNGPLKVSGFRVEGGANAYFDGNVGVGNLSPSAKLDVTGRVKMTEFQLGTSATPGYVLTTNASGVGTWQVAGGGMTNPMNATGDMIYRSATVNPERLGIGGSGTVLVSNGTIPTWAPISGASFGSQTANTFFAAPNGVAGNPTFRTILLADLPTISVAKGGTGLTSILAGEIWVANANDTISKLNPAAGQSIRKLNATTWEAYTPSSGGVPDGNYIDIQVAGSTWTINPLVVTTGKIADSAINNPKILNLAVDNPKIAANAVTTDKITDLTIATADIANNAITVGKIAPSATNGHVLTTSGGVTVWAAPVPGGVTSVSGTVNRITSTGGNTPVIDIAGTYVGQNSITTLGTVTTGVWSATTIAVNKGGTGLTTVGDNSILVANSLDTFTSLAPGAGNSIRVNAAGTAWEAYTPSAGGGGTITGSGTTNRMTKFTGATAIGDSLVWDNGTNVGINTTLVGDATNRLTVRQSANTTPATSGTYGFGLLNQASLDFTLGADVTNAYIQSWNSKDIVINSQGNNVGVNNTNPTEKLDVTGNVRFSGALMPNNLSGVAGLVLTSQGPGVAPTWTQVFPYVAGGVGYTIRGTGATTWTADTNLYNNGVSIGIGTTTPGQKLSIAGSLGIREGGASPTFYTAFTGGDQTTNITYTLPTAVATTNGQVLSSNVSGVLSWVSSGGNMTNPMLIVGDMIYADVSGNPANPQRLPIGAIGEILTVGATGLPDWLPASGGGAPVNATYITQTANATLTNEQTLSTLATGLVKNTTGTGVLSTAVAGTDYLAPFASQTAKTFYAAPNAVNGTPSFRLIVASDIPTLNQNTTGTAGALAANGANCAAGSYPLGVDASGAVEGCTVASGGGGDMLLAGIQTVTGAKTFGVAGNVNKLILAGLTSGTTVLNAANVAGAGVVTLPTTGTLATLAGAETLTNKTISGSTNVLGGITMTLGSDASFDIYYRNASGILTRLPNGTTGQVLTATTAAAPTWAAAGGGGSVTFDALGDAVAAGVVNNGTWPQVWDWNAISTTTGLTMNFNGLTSGKGLSIASTSTVLSANGVLQNITLTGSSASNTGSLLSISDTGALNATIPFKVTGAGAAGQTVALIHNTGLGTSFRINDEPIDVSPLIVTNAGNMAIGSTTVTANKRFEVYAGTGNGVLVSLGVNVTGSGTDFTTNLRVGDTIISAGQTRTIATITSATALTTTAAFSPVLADDAYTISSGTPRFAIAQNGDIDISTHGRVYMGGVRFIHDGRGVAVDDNVFLGANSGNFTLSSTNTDNTGIGDSALNSLSSGVGGNTAVGSSALFSVSSGFSNTAVGLQALNTVTTGSQNTAIGWDADVSSGTLTNATAIGAGAIVTAIDRVQIGNGAVASLFFGDGSPGLATTASAANMFYDSTTGQIMRSTSSKRYKKEIADLEIDSSKIYDLRPVSFTGLSDNARHFGLIAEEVAQTIPQLAEYTAEKNVIKGSISDKLIPDGVQYSLLSVLLLKETQKHEAIIQSQQKAIEELRAEIEKLTAKQ